MATNRKEPAKTGVSDAVFKGEVEAFVTYVQDADRILYLCIRGVSMTRKTPALMKAVAHIEHGEQLPEEERKRIESAERDAEFAEQELENGFPLLHAHTAVAIWSALEALIPRLAIASLTEHPATLKRSSIEKIKVPVAIMESASRAAIMEYIVDELIQSYRGLQVGIARYEALMDAVGLGGKITKKLRRDLYELSHVRNVIAHRYGIVDQRLKTACPWIRTKVGNRIKITPKTYFKYRNAVVSYVTEVTWRRHKASGRRRPRTRSRKLQTNSIGPIANP